MSSYDRQAVEALVFAIWDKDAAYGIQSERVADPTMPKAKSNPAHSHTLYAMLADIRQAWKYADIPQVERQALLLHYGMGWTPKEIGLNQEVTDRAALYRIERGVGRLTAWLNGHQYHDGYAPVLEDEGVTV